MSAKHPSGSSGNIDRLAARTVTIVAAFVYNNAVPSAELPNLIETVSKSLASLRAKDTATPEPSLRPAVPIKKSVTPDYLVCLEDGRRVKVLARYLKSRFGLTPEEYRRRWNLPADYPMVARSYAESRSRQAKQQGFGSRPKHAPSKARLS